MQKVLVFFILSSFFYIKTNAQVVIKGNVKDTTGKFVAYATIIAKNTKTDATVGYTFTDEKGDYSVTIEEKADSLFISFAHINYETIEKIIKYESQTVDFRPEIFSKILKEVFVKAPPIYDNKDTLNYNVSDFANKNDRTLSDVLKKMPGIEVDAGGNVKFQGKSINKFYVEGKDLMEGNYGMITKALPSGDAATVQVLQHHQPVRMLKDKVYSPYAAINIKLKKNVSLTGRAKLGFGFSPFLHDVAITPMLFSKKYQALASFKSNNTGEALNSNIDNEIFLGAYESVQENTKREKWLSIAQSQMPEDNTKRFLFNSDHLLSVNYLTGIAKNLEMRTNLDLLKSNTSLTGSEESTTSLPNGDTISTVKSSNSKQHVKYLNTKITLQNNTENSFFRNTASFKAEYEDDAGTMFMQNMPFSQTLNDRFQNFQNSFSGIFPLDKQKKYNVNIMSLVNYNSGKPNYFLANIKTLTLDSIIASNDSSLLQKLQYKNFTTDNSACFSVTRNHFTITPKLKYKFSQNKVLSALYENAITEAPKENWKNEAFLKSDLKQGSLNIDYKTEKLMMGLSLPVNYYVLRLEDKIHSSDNLTKWAIEPDLNFLYKMNLCWEAILSANRSFQFSDMKELTKGNILSELNQSSHQNGINQTISHIISPGINYKNPFSSIFLNTSYSYYWLNSNTISSLNFLKNGQTNYGRLYRQNSSSMQSANIRIGKFFTNSNTNISFSIGGSKMQSSFVFNNTISNSTLYSYSTTLKLISGALKKFYIDISGVYYKNYRNTFFGKSKSGQFTASSNILFTPYENHAIKLIQDYCFGKYDSNKFSYSILDILYQFSIPKKKIDIELRWNNISNQKIYKQTFITNTSTTSVNYYLRPSEVIVSVMLNIR